MKLKEWQLELLFEDNELELEDGTKLFNEKVGDDTPKDAPEPTGYMIYSNNINNKCYKVSYTVSYGHHLHLHPDTTREVELREVKRMEWIEV